MLAPFSIEGASSKIGAVQSELAELTVKPQAPLTSNLVFSCWQYTTMP
jgi:hypothetical protein